MARERRAADAPAAVKLDAAYDDLTRQAFAVWVRMMVEPESALNGLGVEGLARKFSYKQRAFFEVLRQLRDKGYIRIVSAARPGKPAAILIAKRPLLVGRDHFVKLS